MKKKENIRRKSQRACDDWDGSYVSYPELSTKSKSKELCVAKEWKSKKRENTNQNPKATMSVSRLESFKRIKGKCAVFCFWGHVRVVFSLFKFFLFVFSFLNESNHLIEISL